MPDPTATAAGVAVAVPIVGGTAMVAGVPLTVIVCAVLGAAIAVSRGERLEMTLRAFWAALLTFASALAFGIVGGLFVGGVIERAARHLTGVDLAGLPGDALCALLISLLAHPVLLPAIGRRLGLEIETRGVTKP